MWRVGRALALTFAAAVLVAGSIFYGLVVLLDFKEIDTAAKLDARNDAEFSDGTVSFTGATFSGSRVDFDGAMGSAPRALLTAVGTPAPATVILSPAWLPSNP